MARRLYLAFLGVLLVVFALTATINFFTGRGPLGRPGPFLAGHLARTFDAADDLQRAAEDAHNALGVDIEVVDAAGEPVAQAGNPIDLPPPHMLRHLHGPDWVRPPRLAAAPLRTRPGLLLLVRMDASRLLLHPLLLLVAILGVTLLLIIPLSRSITRPLEKLTGAVQKYGKGDLSQRSGLGELHDEVGQLARSFDEMADRIQAARKAEKELLANVSHELRTPLARMKVALELIDTPDESLRRRVASVGEEVDELDRLIADVLTATRLDLAALPLHKIRLPLAALLEKSRQRALALDPALQIDVQADPALAVEADEALLSRAVDNLLDNARKYGDGSPVEVAARRDGGQAIIAVRDRGPGIPAAELEHVFDPFFRGEAVRGRASGFGLGLSLARRVAEAHGGTAIAQNADGGGARIELRLPA
ncbi:MAG TPA: HAMP domain-containing sensor histidine kinase [Myxococcales bacterium]|nr:HAMP domain-containing sensor histidine kinase [Myxococcales bacterium]